MSDIQLPTDWSIKPSKLVTGDTLKLHDAEMAILNSGPSGIKRLAAMRAIDIQEAMPNISDEDAQKAGAGYAMIKLLAVNGKLTTTTQAEAQRLKIRD